MPTKRAPVKEQPAITCPFCNAENIPVSRCKKGTDYYINGHGPKCFKRLFLPEAAFMAWDDDCKIYSIPC
jgi:hypothetical protein